MIHASLDQLITELGELDRQLVQVDGKLLKPSQCFRYETDPLHYMFNTNCPQALKEQVQAIFNKHVPLHENRASQQG